MADSKKQLGQFFTKNSDYILSNFSIYVKNKEVADPFAGSGDLLDWARRHGAKKAVGYDIDKKYVDSRKVFLNDNIINPGKYKFVVTNPPYLNVNKADKKTKEKYFKGSNFEDLYQISLSSLLSSDEGIAIVPVNFLSASNSAKIRRIFLARFEIVSMNYFKHQVFPDTTYNVIAFYYRRKKKDLDRMTIIANIYPDNKKTKIKLLKKYDWAIGGEVLNIVKKQKNYLGIYRLMEKEIPASESSLRKIKAAYNHVKNVGELAVPDGFFHLINQNIILLKAIDSGSDKGRIALENIKEDGIDCLISKESSRHMIHLIFSQPVPISQQQEIISLFNKEINKLREDHFSLFLTNYRDKDRKRISFDFVYKFINYLYFNCLAQERQETLFLPSLKYHGQSQFIEI